ncbi:Chromatin-remodeling ATPase INO80 [Labeo rohita]|uniref:Chromatin-remodeling ATPase INO80 n=1 Tax=Labeo rohita TaxID=84645 RepID=A0ABQ8MV14_LABRO|nr:Chromatin-remodeling ATPase INO80 [Labeo rohita]
MRSDLWGEEDRRLRRRCFSTAEHSSSFGEKHSASFYFSYQFMCHKFRMLFKFQGSDVCLMEGFRCGLDDDLHFVMPHGDPCWTLQNYINLALWMSGSTFTLGEAEEDSDLVQPHLTDVSQQDPEPSPPPPRLVEPEPEPTADGEPEPIATELSPLGVTALENAMEPEPIKSDQVREPATMPATGDVPVEHEGAEDSTAHCTAEGERSLELGLLEIELDLTNFTEDSHPRYSPSAHHQCGPSASWLEDPSSPPPASESCAPPWPFDPAAPPRLSAPSSPSSPIGPPAPPGSIIPPAPPWSVVPPSPLDSTPLAAPRRSVPPAPLGSSLPPALPQSAVAPAPLRPSGSPPLPRSPEPWAPPWPFGSSVSPWIFGSPSPPAPPPSVGPLESSAIPPPWLLPRSTPPWTTIVAAIWVSPGSSCSGFLLSPPWLNPLSSPPWTLFVVLLLGVRPPPEPPPTLNFLLPAHIHSFVLFVLRRESDTTVTTPQSLRSYSCLRPCSGIETVAFGLFTAPSGVVVYTHCQHLPGLMAKTYLGAQEVKKEEDKTRGLQSKRCEILRHDRQAGLGVHSLTCVLKSGKGEKQQTESRKAFVLRSWGVRVFVSTPFVATLCPRTELSSMSDFYPTVKALLRHESVDFQSPGLSGHDLERLSHSPCQSTNQAMRSKELSVDLTDRIVSRHRSGEMYRKISAVLKVPICTVASIICKRKKFGTTRTLSRVGCLAKLSQACMVEWPDGSHFSGKGT